MINKQHLKGFIVGILITLMLFSIVFAAPVTKTVKAVFNTINMQINGKAVKADTITYNKVLYAPVKTVAEALGKDFKWDTKTNAVTINDKPIPQPNSKDIEFTNILVKHNLGLTSIYGEATNKTKTAQTLTIKVTFLDKENKVIGIASGIVNDLNAGETKTFAAVAVSDCSNAASYKVQLDGMTQSAGVKPELITFADATIKTTFGLANVELPAKNNDTKPHSFTATISFYDKDKKLIGVAFGAVNDLAAGETKTLSAMSLEDVSSYATYKVQIHNFVK